jgi:hypothetical protein
MTTSEIANFKMIGDVIELRECYQCGGETLGPVVKHSVRDSRLAKLKLYDLRLNMIRPDSDGKH